MASKKYIDGGEGADQKMQALVMKIIGDIDEHVNIDFSQDQVLIEWLSVHLQTAIPRMKFHLFAAFIGESSKGRMDSAENRVDAIIRAFFLSTLQNTSLTQQQLADSLYVSLSTLKSDMKEAKERLAEYGLTIGTYKTEGMRLEGEEGQIRNFISQYNFLQTSDSGQVAYFQRLFPDIDIPQLLDILICVSDSYQLHLTDMAIHNLVVHTAIAIGRAQQSHTMTYTLRQTKHLEKTKEFEVATSMFEEIFRKTGIDVAAGEIYYLAQHLDEHPQRCLRSGEIGIPLGLPDCRHRQQRH